MKHYAIMTQCKNEPGNWILWDNVNKLPTVKELQEILNIPFVRANYDQLRIDKVTTKILGYWDIITEKETPK